MGFTALIVQTFAGDVIDKTSFDRRSFLSIASAATAISASAILFVREGNNDHILIFATKIIEGISSSFIGPCVAALTLATFGPNEFDEVMASNILWGHIGSIASAVLAGLAGFLLYPNIKYCFLVIGFSALMAVGGIALLPEGDPLLGRGLQRSQSKKVGDTHAGELRGHDENEEPKSNYFSMEHSSSPFAEVEVSSYRSVFFDNRTVVLCLTGFFFQ